MRLPARCMEAMASGRRMRRRGPFEMVKRRPRFQHRATAITGLKRREYGEGRGTLYIYPSHYRLLTAWLFMIGRSLG
jgi:hypothetical protein